MSEETTILINFIAVKSFIDSLEFSSTLSLSNLFRTERLQVLKILKAFPMAVFPFVYTTYSAISNSNSNFADKYNDLSRLKRN